MSRLLRLAGFFGILGMLLLLLAPQASAHALVVGSDPADGARLPKVPAALTVRFSESVGLGLGYLRVVDSAGRQVDAGDASHPGGTGSAIRVSMKSGLGDGTYLASYRVISADSHPIGGSLRFVVGNGAIGTETPSAGTATHADITVALAVSHWLSFAGVALVGGTWLIFSLWPAGQRRPAIRRAVWSGWTLAALGAVCEFLLQGPYAAGSSLFTFARSDLLDATLHVSSGKLLSLRVLLLGVLSLALRDLFASDGLRSPDLGETSRGRTNWGPETAAIVGVGIVITFAASGHTQSADPRWLAVLVDALHLAAMIIWFGGLAMLLIAAYSGAHQDETEPLEADTSGDLDQIELAAGLPIFSRVAMASVAVLAVTGTIQAWREVGTVDALATTSYGLLVIAKVALLAALVTLGYFARRTVLRRSEGSATVTKLRRGVLTEVLLGAVVLAITAVLIAQPPGKVALAADRAKPKVATVALSAGSSARVEISPGVHGQVRVAVRLSGASPTARLTASASLPTKQLGPIPIDLKASGPQNYTATNLMLPTAGIWVISLAVQGSEFESTTAVVRLRIS